jgi:hypothetical protein
MGRKRASSPRERRALEECRVGITATPESDLTVARGPGMGAFRRKDMPEEKLRRRV